MEIREGGRRFRVWSLSVVMALLATPLAVATASTAAAAPSAPSLSFSLDWREDTDGHVADSSPVLVENGGAPFVAAATRNGAVHAFDLETGQPKGGHWGLQTAKPRVRAPLSSDGNNVYVPIAQDHKDRYPSYKKLNSSGVVQWDSNPAVSDSASGFLLAGLSLGWVDGAWRGFAGSSGHHLYGVNTSTASGGAQLWSFQNADSTMATPAVANLFGTADPQVIWSNDTSKEFADDKNGGIFRIMTANGSQICSDTQLVDGDTYASSGYNNSSPAVAEIDGRPLIVFGSTGPTQFGTGGNQIVGYDATCKRRWATRDLHGRAEPSPVFADVLGWGTPQVVQLVAQTSGGKTYPRIYVINPSNGDVLADTGSTFSSYGASSVAYPQAISITTADFNEDGAQDLVVPAKQGSFLVLDGKTRSVLTTIPTSVVIQNTPLITETAGGVRVTFAGYNGLGGRVESFVSSTGGLGTNGWHSFGNDPQLSRTQGSFDGPYDQLVESQVLHAGSRLTAPGGGWFAEMEAGGNLVVRRGDGTLRWQSATSVPGSYARMTSGGALEVRSPGGSLLWSSGTSHPGVTRLVLDASGVLTLSSGTPRATRQLNDQQTLWSSQSSQIEPPGRFVPITPCRVVDTRSVGGRLGNGTERTWRIRGAGGCGIPTAAKAVEATVTAVSPNGAGYFRAWPSNASQPNATFLNYSGEGVSNTGALTLGTATNDLRVKNFGGSSHYVIDVQGYYVSPEDATGAAPGTVFVSTTPCRVVDTRFGGGSLASLEQRAWQVRGAGGGFGPQGGKSGGCAIPAAATAVEATVTATSPQGTGFFRAWPSNRTAPEATFLNYARGGGISNTGSIALGTATHDLAVRNYGARSHFVVDVQGYFVPADQVPAGAVATMYVPSVPCRIVDTRFGGGRLAADAREWQVRGSGGGFTAQGGLSSGCSIPQGATAVEATVAAVGPTSTGYFRAWPSDVAPPTATYLNFARSRNISNTGSVGVGTATRDLAVRNYGGSTHYVVDIQGAYVPVED